MEVVNLFSLEFGTNLALARVLMTPPGGVVIPTTGELANNSSQLKLHCGIKRIAGSTTTISTSTSTAVTSTKGGEVGVREIAHGRRLMAVCR